MTTGRDASRNTKIAGVALLIFGALAALWGLNARNGLGKAIEAALGIDAGMGPVAIGLGTILAPLGVTLFGGKRAFLFSSRMVLAAILIGAAYIKLSMSWLSFAASIAAYQAVPDSWLEPIARTLPWGEMLLGIGLLSGLLKRWFGAGATLLLTFFFVLLIRSYVMGLQIDCGCFGPGDPLGPKTLFRDGAMCGLSALYTWLQFRPQTAEEEIPVGGLETEAAEA